VAQTAPVNKRLQRTRHERASLLSCVGEPLKRNVMRFSYDHLANPNNVNCYGWFTRHAVAEKTNSL
jgi:hypothetical protein